MFRKSLSLVLLLGAPLLFGACSDEPALIIDRKSFDFGDLEVGEATAEQLFTVRNASPHDVASVGVSVEGSDAFAITSNTCEKYLAAGMECEVRVRYAPRLGGTHSASLKVAGAPSAERTELQGTAFAWVDVTSLPPGTRIVAGDDSFTCTQPCRHAVRTAELTLYVNPEGFPTWSAACASAPRSGCLLRMDASKVVALNAWLPLYQWEVRRSRPPMAIAPLPYGNIVVLDSLGVTSLDGAGQERWSLTVPGTARLVVTSDGAISLLRYDGTVTQYDSEGRPRWTYSAQGIRSGEFMTADTLGNTYVLLTQGNENTAVVMKLIALSREGVELWSTVINEGPINYPSGLGVMGDGSHVYVVGGVYKRGATPQELVFEKNFTQKLTPAGVALWTKPASPGGVSFTPSGEMLFVFSNYSPPGGVVASWSDSDGDVLWESQTRPEKGPGVVDTYAAPPNFNTVPRLLLGGHELLPGTNTYGRGWFADMGDRTKLAPGAITYIESPYGNGAWVSSVVYSFPARHVVVGGGFGSHVEPVEGFIRLYDPLTLTMER
ncbi:choice-of-anchor D domain-containing protein [Corallococcus interemptor]|uniref:choice-of-anchor D domain-containing protein n=1 Tax=Corallococcus interemptor TaxID=2316720 RepID=UPI0035D51E56